ncbi:MAG TPA: hypothetical protein PKD27_14915, partial [Tepidiformaceae bacterium]|nr:hypothetical protein [Tepidiformaceae bacterium]
TDHGEAAQLIRRSVLRELSRIQRKKPKKLVEERYARYREIGSTRSWVRGRLERRLAHLQDRAGAAMDRFRRRTTRRPDYDESDIPV